MSDSAAKPTTSLRGIFALVGFGLLVCAVVALGVAACDAWAVHVRSTWPSTNATIDQSLVSTIEPSGKYGRKEISYLTCLVHYEVKGRLIRGEIEPISSRREDDVVAMRKWMMDHQPGSGLTIRYDPRNPQHAIIRDLAPGLPQRYRPKLDLELAAIFGVAGVILIALTRRRAS